MIKVLHVYRTYFPETQGGLEEAIRQICSATKKNGTKNRIFTLSSNQGESIIKRDEAEVYRYHKIAEIASCGISFSSLSGFKELVEWADVVHYHFPWPFADLMHKFGNVKKPTLVTYHSDIVRQKGLMTFYRPMMNYFLGSVDHIVATSQNYIQSSRVLSQYQNKMRVIPIGLDEASFPQRDNSHIKKIRDLVGEGFFLFIGALRSYKGIHVLLDAVKNTDLKVVIAGFGPIRKELLHQINSEGSNNVNYLGHVDDQTKMALIELSTAVVLPSIHRSEAFGVTLLEGAMLGKPLISTELGTGTSYVNHHLETGFVIPPSNSEILFEVMNKLLMDKKLSIEMGKAAKKRFNELFTSKRMGEKYMELYKDMVKNE